MQVSSASMSQADRTFVELLRRRAFERPTRLACSYLGDGEVERSSLTYGALDRRARAIGAQLAALGATGERVLLLYPSGLEFIAAFFGCLYAGAVAVPAYPPRVRRHMSRLQTILADAQALVALTTTSVLSRVEPFIRGDEQMQALRWVVTDTLADDLAEDWREPEIDPSTLAFLQYTSGSTAAPKGVMVSHSNLLHNERLIQSAFRQTDESTIVGWLPLYHDMGLIGNVLQTVYLGASSILMAPTSFLQSPVRWLQAISDYRATTSGAPNFAYDLCVRRITPAQRETLDLSSWSVAYNGAEPARRETMERFAAAFAQCGFRREAFFPCYGLAEATLFVAGKLRDGVFGAADFRADGLEKNQAIAAAAGDEARALVSCGGTRTHTDQQFLIVDPVSHEKRPESVIGEIWVAGPSVAKGYWNQPTATAETFHARLAVGDERPFLRTGDLGFLHQGELFITGRLKDLIIIRGRNHYPQDIEWSVERSHAAVAPGCGAAFSIDVEGEERLVIAQEVEAETPERQTEIIHAIQQAIAENHEIQVYAIALLKARTISKTSSGKIQRHACRVGFLSGKLRVLAEWRAPSRSGAETTTHIQTDGDGTLDLEQVTAWLIQELTVGAIGNASHIDAGQSCAAAGLDSLGAVDLVHRIEMKFGVIMSPASFLADTSVAELARAILAGSAAGVSDDGSPPAAIEHSGPYPLSRGQQALWFLRQLQPESAAYNISSALRITTELDDAALRNAFNALVERHAALRTTFSAAQNGELAQHTHERAENYFIEHDARSWTEEEVTERLIEEANKPFDLAQGPTCRLHMFVRGQRERILLLSIHHIIADFWSLGVLLHELGEIYTAKRRRRAPKLPPLNLRYEDYVRWQAETLAGAEGVRLWRYWQQQLAGASLALDLPVDKPRQALQSHRGASLPARLDTELALAIKELGHSRQATLFMTLLAAFYALLYRYTGQSDLLVGSPVAGRSRAGFSGIVGYFVNPLVLRAQISERMSFSELLAQVRQTALAGLEHQEYPFPMLVERLQPKRDSSYSPLFQVMFVLQKARHSNEERLAAFALGEAQARIKLGELELESIALKQRVAQFDLTLAMTEMDYGLGMSWQYCADLFEPATIERMAGHFHRLLEGMTADPTAPIHTLPMLTPPEERQILLEWNATAKAYPRQQCIHQLFEAQVERTPDRIAIIRDSDKLTYRQLNARANRLARRIQGLGVKPELRVAVLAERSIELVVGLLGILKAGGAYVPLDPAYPGERLRVMLEDSEARVMLLGAGVKELAPEYGGEIVKLETESNEWNASEEKEYGEGGIGVEVVEENVAYTLYTSGSTGRPKGVAIEHRSAVAFLHWALTQFTPQQLARTLFSTSICFDLSVFEIFAPLSCGGMIIMAENALQLPQLPAANDVTLINTVPSAMAELLRMGAVPASVRTINLAGEALLGSLVERIYQTTAARQVFNLYGPTEATTYATYEEAPRDLAGNPSIGRPIANTQVYILNEALQPTPVGVIGEVYIGGAALARDYLNQPALTAERFTPNPFDSQNGARMYRTGDLARFLPDGRIEYLGRSDHQVKIRGFRIELGEIEAVLLMRPDIRSAVVTPREVQDGQKNLVAYLVAADAETPSVAELREYLRTKLPEHMTPSYYVWLPELPLTPNGKINRRALPEPQWSRPQSTENYLAPRTPTETALADIWRQVLKLERVGVEDDFFELGGHSLLATQIASRVKESLRVELPLHSLFASPTIARLAEIIERLQGLGVESGVTAIKPVARAARRVTLPQ